MWLTAKYEVQTTLGRRSFWLTTFILPAVVLLLAFVPQIFMDAGGDDGVFVPDPSEQSQPIGYVDPGRVLKTSPAGLSPDLVRSYDDEAQAKTELSSGIIDRYYLISEDYLTSGRLTVVQARYQPLRSLEHRDLLTYILNTGITGNDTVAGLLLNPVARLESRSLQPIGSAASADHETGFVLPYLLMFVLYFALAMTSGFMLQSVSREKENRTAEVLLVSLRPRDLLMGKIIGLSVVGLLQVIIWLAVIFAAFRYGGGIFTLDVSMSADLLALLLPWTIVYFLLGYLLYASIYSILSVLAPSARDAGQFVFIAIIPLAAPLLLSSTFAEAPNGALATTLSLFPLTSPVAMVSRLGATSVPWWQLVAGAVVIGVLAYLFVLLAGRLFRADNLLSTRALTWQRLRSEFHSRGVGQRPTKPEGEVSVLETRNITPAGRSRDSARPTDTDGDAGDPDSTLKQSSPEESGSRIPGLRPIYSRQRVFMVGLIGVAMLILGLREYMRGDTSGLLIAGAGAVFAAGAYYKYRQNR